MGPTAAQRTPRHWAIDLSIHTLALTLTPVAWAAAPKPAGCVIEPDQVVDVGSPVTGIIESLQVVLGDRVEEGQTLVVLRADVERANAAAANLRTQMDAEVKASAANLELARQKTQRTQQLLNKDFVSQQALDQSKTELEVAEQKHQLARSQQQIYAQEQSVARAQLRMRTLRSPIKGLVVERYSNPGERVEDRPVLRVASIDPLRVSLMVPIAQYGQVAVGSQLAIRPDLPGMGAVKATVSYVDKIIDAASNTFRVRLSLPNPDNRLPAGLRCKAEWPAIAAATAPAADPRPPAAVPAAVPSAAPRQTPAPAPIAAANPPPAANKKPPAAGPLPTTQAALTSTLTLSKLPVLVPAPVPAAAAKPLRSELKMSASLARPTTVEAPLPARLASTPEPVALKLSIALVDLF